MPEENHPRPSLLYARVCKRVDGKPKIVSQTYLGRADKIIEKPRQHLGALQRQLRRWRDGKIRGGRKPSLAGTQTKIDDWLRARHMRDLFAVQGREVDGLPKVNYRFQRRAWETLQRRLLGKTLLLTDQAV